MKIEGFVIDDVVFPGVAGELQRREDVSGLVSELGRNYRRYHAFLAETLGETGRPDPKDYDSFVDYTAAWRRQHHLVHAELFLRYCRARGSGPAALAEALRPGRPVVDEKDGLVALDV